MTVNAPNGGEKWFIQGAYDITWTAIQGTFPLAANPITVSYSTAGPAGPWTQIATNLLNTGIYNWSIPSSVPPSVTAYIKVDAKDNQATPLVGSDVGNAASTFLNGNPPVVTVTSPNGGEVWVVNFTKQVTWTTSPGTFPIGANPVTISISRTGPSGPWTQIATGLPNTYIYGWNVSAPTGANNYIKIDVKDDRPTPNIGNDTSNAAFNITDALPPVIKVEFPNGGEIFSIGTPIDIRWNVTAGTYPLAQNPITIWYSSNGSGGPWSQVVTNRPNSGKYTWTLPMTPSNTSCFKVGAVDTKGNGGSDVCDADFKIIAGNAPPYLNMVSPVGGEIWKGIQNIVWEGADGNKNTVTYNISASPDGGGTWNLVNSTSYTENSTVVQHSYSLNTTALNDGTLYRIRIDADDHNGSVVSKLTQNITIDNNPPKSNVEPLTPYVTSTKFTVKWNGTDNASGIDHYDIYYSTDQGSFTKWNTTTNTSKDFTGVEGHRYGFYSIAFDKAGHSETKSVEEAWTRIDATVPVTSIIPLPRYVNSSMFDISYNVTDASPVNITLYHKKDIGIWDNYGNFSKSPIPYTASGQGVYEFYIEGMDAAGNKESKAQVSEAATTVDTTPPLMRITLKKSVVNVSEITAYYDASDNYELQTIRILYSKSLDNQSWGSWLEGFTQSAGGAKSISKSGPVKVQGSGFYRLRSCTTDAANNTDNGTGMAFFRVDTDAPMISSVTPADGSKNVSLSPEVKITFSEPMNRATVEKAISISNVTGSIPFAWDSTSSTISFNLAELLDNASYTITVTSMAQDQAGNKLKKTEFTFNTIPTRGTISGRVIGSDGVYVKGARLTLKSENGSKGIEVSTDSNGAFAFYDVLAGNYTISGIASGYDPSDISVKVIAGYTVPVTITMQKNNTMLYIGAGVGIGILAFFLLMFLLTVVRKRRKCPACGTKVKRKAEVCPKCGARIPLGQKAPKPMKKPSLKKGEKGAEEKGEAPPIPVPGEIYAAPKTPTKCPSCKEDVPAGEEWCPNCGAMVAMPAGAKQCPKCGGTMGEDDACITCGFSETGGEAAPALLPEIDMHQPGQECPRCYAPLEKGSKFCSICGGDVDKMVAKQKKKEDRVATMKADAKPGAKIDMSEKKPQPPPIPEPSHSMMPQEVKPSQPPGPKCNKCGSPMPVGAKWCDVCGDKKTVGQPPIPRPTISGPVIQQPQPTPTQPPPPPIPHHGPATPPPAVAPIHSMPAQSGPRCRTCNSPVPVGSKWCDVCGEKT